MEPGPPTNRCASAVGRYADCMSATQNRTKVAIVTDDGRTVAQHFGRAAYYLVVTLADGVAVNRELRPRITPHAASGQHHHHEHDHEHGHEHGTGPAAAARHAAMAAQIADCQFLIAGGMGRGAVRAMEAAGLQVTLTNLSSIEEVIAALAAGKLQNESGRMH